jgi:Zn-dependent peptidase ImmA (M78 family)
MSHEHDHGDAEHEVAEEAEVAAPRMSPVAQLQRNVGNAQLLQLRAKHAVQKRDLVEEARADQAARKEEQMASQGDEAQVAIPSGGQSLPQPVQARAEAELGVPMGDVKVVHGADNATDPIGAKAFTTEQGGTPTVVMGSADMGSPDAQFTLMHELTHVAQQKRGMAGGLDGLGGDEGQRESLENHADAHAAKMLDPAHKH